MARTLSEIRRRAFCLPVIAGWSLAVTVAMADEAANESAGPKIIENPFSAGAPRPAAVAKQATPLRRKDIVYRNPFAVGEIAPQVEIPALPGPVSRWRRSVPLMNEPSPVRTAILSADPIEGLDAPWDEIPPAEMIRQQSIAKQNDAIAKAEPKSEAPPDPIEFAPTPLAQPMWLRADPLPGTSSPIGQVSFDQVIVDESLGVSAGGPVLPESNSASIPPVVITDFDDSPEGWLGQAQQAAGSAKSLDELKAVTLMCQRGLENKPGAETSTALRRLAAWAHNRRGELLASADRQADAIGEFQLAISLDGQCSLAIHNRAVTLAEQNQHSAALRDFNRVIELNPGLAVAYRNRAELLSMLGRMNEAAADYSKAIESLPDDAELYAARGYAWQRLGEFERARADLNRALEIAPDDPETLAERGNLAAECGDYDNAVADLKRAISVDPTFGEAYRSIAWLRATCSDERHRDAAEALSAARKTIELTAPGDYLALEALAAASAAAGQFEEAVAAQQQAIANTPPELVGPARQRLELYQSQQPFRSGTAAARPSPALRTR